MITARIKKGIFTYQYRIAGTSGKISGSKQTVNLMVPYLSRKIKKAAH